MEAEHAFRVNMFIDSSRGIATAHHLMSAAERLAPDIEKFWNKLDQVDEGGTFSLSDIVGRQYQNIFTRLCRFAIEGSRRRHML